MATAAAFSVSSPAASAVAARSKAELRAVPCRHSVFGGVNQARTRTGCRVGITRKVTACWPSFPSCSS
ncbi:Aspartate aminotransferase chloroplastic [Zea mays]|uniref:Aspartate aminotransferase chloroplastic n=1 Tax=Zea mays TaxID=4577 RepID=A0A1D6HNF8_MAIZE|nr:Aspartate aminotransferase chloroplastic [Zea mays]